MGTDGQRGSSTTHPANMLQTLLRKREKLQNDLRNIETQVYELETSYLNEFRHFGNVWKSVEASVSSSKTTTNLKRSRKLQPEDRLFSLSSVTSPVGEELRTVHQDAASEFGLGRHNSGSGPINGAGKPKKGRTAIRVEAKRIRLPDEPDINGENDPSMSSR